MKVAFVSYEYPPDTAIGGIATYVRQAAQMLAQRGHSVEVFTASTSRSGRETDPNHPRLTVHRVRLLPNDRSSFAETIAPTFAKRHQIVSFDVLEGPDCGADAAVIVQQFPDLPFVLKLHTPSYLLRKFGHRPLSAAAKTRFILGALRRAQWPKLPEPLAVDRQSDPEYRHALSAHAIAAPCQAIGQQVQTDWQLEPSIFSVVPLPYAPTPTLLNIPLDTTTQRVTFIGRLEIRKGILDLMQAIPWVLQQYPAAKFRFVGPPWPSPKPSLNMQEYMNQKLRRYRDALEFTGAVALDKIPDYLAETDICVFPSIWENFPLVCLEAMAAGRAIVGSSAGGMAEQLAGGQAGLLVAPQSPKQLAEAILQLLKHPARRQQYGASARDRVLNNYSLERIGQIQEASYRSAIDLQANRTTVRL
jgi:glycosyltransferase involved in cell wall biosynthesis